MLASTVIPLSPIATLPTAGILIGGAMTATSISSRRTADELRTRRGEYEAALSICLCRREAVVLVARPATALCLVPGRTCAVGLVTLPGAFVGVLLAGASPGRPAAVPATDNPAVKAAAALEIDGAGVKVAYLADGVNPLNKGLRRDLRGRRPPGFLRRSAERTGLRSRAYGDTSAVAQGNVVYDIANPEVVSFAGGHRSPAAGQPAQLLLGAALLPHPDVDPDR